MTEELWQVMPGNKMQRREKVRRNICRPAGLRGFPISFPFPDDPLFDVLRPSCFAKFHFRRSPPRVSLCVTVSGVGGEREREVGSVCGFPVRRRGNAAHCCTSDC